MKSRELESKFEVSQEDFVKIKETGKIKELREQLNIYFDHENYLSSRSITFRIRVSSKSNPKMTLKIPAHQELGFREVIEIEKELDSDFDFSSVSKIDIDNELPKEFRDYLQFFNLKELNKIGSMKTNRWVTYLNPQIEVELDEVELPNGNMFFEVEVENDEYDYRKAAENILKDIAHNIIPSRCSKYERFTEAINNLSTQAVSLEKLNHTT
ncbi:MAG: CYTH domain-containing protein [Balneola sp.]